MNQQVSIAESKDDSSATTPNPVANAPPCPECENTAEFNTGRTLYDGHPYDCEACSLVFNDSYLLRYQYVHEAGRPERLYSVFEEGVENETTTKAASDGLTPCVQYDVNEEGEGGKRAPTLTPIYSPIPDDASFASPIYFVADAQLERQYRLDNPYAIEGEYDSIATELQDECEDLGRVSYPLYVESDDIGEKGRYEVYEALHESVREIFGVDPKDCRWFFSGGRSIHAHLPLTVHTEEQLIEIRSVIEEYNEDADVELDSQLYTRKRLFRLANAIHQKTGYPKVELSANASEDEINRQIVDGYKRVSEDEERDDESTFLDVIEDEGLEWSVEDDAITHTSPNPPCVLG
jgi:hypothetical protein